MTQDEQNVAIAEFMGWTRIRMGVYGAGAPERNPTPHGFAPGKSYLASVPRYTDSLDLIHDAVLLGIRSLAADQTFTLELRKIIAANQPSNRTLDMDYCDATADQRVEAFLKTTGLWK